jgi:Ca2+-binding EF-hand superfamily protein
MFHRGDVRPRMRQDARSALHLQISNRRSQELAHIKRAHLLQYAGRSAWRQVEHEAKMSDHYYRKPLVLALAGALTLTVAVYTYQQYAHSSKQAEPHQASSLRRSNAIRRSRASRPSPDGYQPVLDYDPIQRALRNLNRRNEERQGYGQYHNTYFFPVEVQSGLDLELVPDNLREIYNQAVQRYPAELSAHQQTCLRHHIYCLFIQNFLQEEFPADFTFQQEAETLVSALSYIGIRATLMYRLIRAFDNGHTLINSVNFNPDHMHDGVDLNPPPAQTDGAAPEAPELGVREVLQVLAGRDANDEDSDSEMSFGNRDDDPGGSQNMLDLLYHIASEQARREGYIHRGVECNCCGTHPIVGIRYHCSNCFDYDLCESCEATSPHSKSHVFYKIRIPVPSRGNVKQVIPKWYPGIPDAFMTSLLPTVSKRLVEETSLDRTEIDALYEQFKCIASHYFPDDHYGIGVAIDRKGFDAYFLATNGETASPANLIYDRIFDFYDTDCNGLITFHEFVRGIDRLQDKSRSGRLKRIFDGYDLDGDGYVDRKDFLRMFRAYYALTKELTREMITTQGDFSYNDEELQEVVQGSQPISAAFGGANFYSHGSRSGQDKQSQPNGDPVPVNGTNDVLQHDHDPRGDRSRAIGNAAVGNRSRSRPMRAFRRDPPLDEPIMLAPRYGEFEDPGRDGEQTPEENLTGPDASLQAHPWPPVLAPTSGDITEALGNSVSLDDITDPVDRTRVLYTQSQRLEEAAEHEEEEARDSALAERWQRRQFYVDEEEGLTKPPGYEEPDSSDEEDEPDGDKKRTSPRRASMASRSSSKVRFDDSAIDTDFETRSNTSSRSIPVNERWGGYELSQAEADIGKNILYQAVQQGLNHLLDALFKEKEDAYMAAQQTRKDREMFKEEAENFTNRLAESPDVFDKQQIKELEELADRVEKDHQRVAYDKSIWYLHKRSDATVEGSASRDWTQEAVPEVVLKTVDNSLPGSISAPDEPYRDPTLPQFRPDEETEVNGEKQTSIINIHSAGSAEDDCPAVSACAASEEPSSTTPKRRDPFAGDMIKARDLLLTWQRHALVELEAKSRGGPGKLDREEFRRKMCPDEPADRNKDGADDGDDKDEDKWESSADLGRLAFVSTWLEMASF